MATRFLNIAIILLLLAIGLTSCYKDVDYSGFFRSSESANQRFNQSMIWNEQNESRIISVDDDNYSLIFASDGHIGDTRNFIEILNQYQLIQADALFLAGDIVSGHQVDYELMFNIIEEYDSCNYFMTVGNHELYFAGWEWFYQYFGSSVYLVEVHSQSYKDLIIILDSGSGSLGSLQLEWLTDVLENKRGYFRNCFVVQHSNLLMTRFSTSATPVTAELEELISLFAQYNVNLVITGHNHKRSEDQLGITTFISLNAFIDSNPDASFMLLEANENGYEYSFVLL